MVAGNAPCDRNHRRVGIVVIHGIGRQRPGETRDRFAEALGRAFPSAMATHEGPSATVLHIGDSQVRIYEAYWADLLSGFGVARSFTYRRMASLAWHPRIA